MGNMLPWSNAASYRAIERTKAKREERFELARQKVANYCQKVEEREQIHGMSLLELQQALQSGEFIPSQVLYAYAHYALEAQTQLNCIAEFLLESFEEAEILEREYSSTEKKPPLFGIPFSVKGNFYLKGYDCCIGNARLLDSPREEDCTFVTHLRNLGAIPFCYTNVPQTLISFCCSNPVYGTTGNPHNPKRTPGGSSGGEAALLAAGGTPFATGGDIGGSLRIPAHFCGVYTLKPVQARFEILNAHGGIPGHGRLGLATSVFANSTQELIMLLGHILGNEDYHANLMPKSAPIPLDFEKIHRFEQDLGKSKLRIGYHFDDGFIKPVPACARAVQRCVDLLQEEGHELVHFPIPDAHNAASILFKNLSPDGAVFFRKTFAENPVDPYLKKFALMLKIPFFIRCLLAFIVQWFSPQLAIVLRAYVRRAEDVRQAQDQLDCYVNMFTKQWKAAKLDLLIVPSFPLPAVPHHSCSDLVPLAFATALYNMLDFPAGHLPVGKVSAKDDQALLDETQWSTGANLLLKQMRSAAAGSAGMPVGVQIVGLPYEEEKCLALMQVLEKKLNDA